MGCIQPKNTSNNNNPRPSVTTFNEKLFKTVDYRLIQSTYTVTPTILGSGNFGKVFLAFHNVNYEFKVAVKTMKKKKIGENLKKLKSEIKILSKLDHPNICKYYETYESPNYVYLIMEYCGGGDLFDRITSQKEGSNFSEQKAAIIMKKLFLAINHCHTNGVVHRDLKPENIMYKENKNSNSSIDDVKIIDFGLSKLL